MSTGDTEYTDEFAGGCELMWGQGFLSPGGKEEVLSIVDGADLKGKKILDIGSGLGGPAINLAREFEVGHITGIDIEPLNVERATRYAQEAEVTERVSFQTVDGGNLPFGDEAFDVVFSKDAITEASNKDEIFQECLRVMRPGGWLMMSDWFRGSNPHTPEMKEWLIDVGVTLDMATADDTAHCFQILVFPKLRLRTGLSGIKKEQLRN